MGVRAVLLLAVFLNGCAPSLHTIYRDSDRGVFFEEETGLKRECPQTYSSWDGIDWWDYYGFPCHVFIKRLIKEVPDASAPRPRH